MKCWYSSFLLMVLVAGLTSCGDVKQLNYFQGNVDTSRSSTFVLPKPTIQQGDLISIVVYSDNPEATAIYNQPVANAGITSTGQAGQQSGGYLVDNNGNIQFQGLGNMKVEGLNKEQLVQLLDSHLKDKLLQNPYYNIRFLNFKITVVGDVNAPGLKNIPNERVNVIEAIGMAGDLTIWGKRDNITVIRERNGVREFGKLDLTKTDVFQSPYYFLQQNDIVIVNAQERKAAAVDQTTARNIQIGTSIVSVVAILISLLR